MYISINGKPVASDSRVLRLAEGYSFGYGLFETVKVMDGKLMFWEQHMERLRKGLAMIRLNADVSSDEVKKNAQEIMRLNEFSDGALKVIVSKRGDTWDTIISTRVAEYPDSLYKRGFKLGISSSRRNPYSVIPKVKSLNYMENIIERELAVKKGLDDCLFLNTDDFVAETSISNIFFVKDGALYTPSIETGILDGVVRAVVISISERLGYRVFEGKYSLQELMQSEEVFLTNSLMGVMPVSEIGSYEIDLQEKNTTRDIREAYGELLYGENDI